MSTAFRVVYDSNIFFSGFKRRIMLAWRVPKSFRLGGPKLSMKNGKDD